jgi:hypothetical protein
MNRGVQVHNPTWDTNNRSFVQKANEKAGALTLVFWMRLPCRYLALRLTTPPDLWSFTMSTPGLSLSTSCSILYSFSCTEKEVLHCTLNISNWTVKDNANQENPFNQFLKQPIASFQRPCDCFSTIWPQAFLQMANSTIITCLAHLRTKSKIIHYSATHILLSWHGRGIGKQVSRLNVWIENSSYNHEFHYSYTVTLAVLDWCIGKRTIPVRAPKQHQLAMSQLNVIATGDPGSPQTNWPISISIALYCCSLHTTCC